MSKQQYSEQNDYKSEKKRSVTSVLLDNGVKVLSRAELGSMISKKILGASVAVPRKALIGVRSTNRK